MVIPWTIIDSPAAARAFADQLEAAPISRARMTSISAALTFSKELLDTSGVRGIRRVIDVSGDGPNNAGVLGHRHPRRADRGRHRHQRPADRAQALQLVGMFDLEDLDRYYTDCVIGGTGAFMIPIREPGEFKTATRRKLLLEISGLETPARLIRAPEHRDAWIARVGERQWRRYLDGMPN